MQSIAVFSDVHGNLEALDVVVDHINDQAPDIIISLGDIVGYGPNPKECIRKVEEIAHIQIVGNWDYAIFTENLENFNPVPKKSLEWTMEQLNDEEKKNLGSKPLYSIFPLFISEGNAMFVHGSPRSPLRDYVSPDLPEWTYSIFFEITRDFAEIDFLFLGHTHKPLHITVNKKHLFNPGSVGQPRDNDPRASFMLFELDARKKEFNYELIRLDYDIKETQKKMKDYKMNKFLIERLEKGI